MALTLTSIRKLSRENPPHILLYGQPGIGKTTLAAEFPNPIFIQFEDGLPKGLEVNSFGIIDTLEQGYEALDALASEEHDFGTIVIDSITAQEEAIWKYLCTKNRWQSIETPGYGRGYQEALEEFRKFLNRAKKVANARGMGLVLIGHARVTEYPDPVAGAYSKLEVDIHKKCVTELESEMDAILCLKNDVEMVAAEARGKVAESSSTVWAYCRGQSNILAKNRFEMPQKLPIKRGKGFETLAPYFE